MDTYKIAVSKYSLSAKIPQGDEFWGKFNGSFQNRELATDEVLQAIYDGYPITTWHKNNWRNAANYLCGQYVGLDFDSGDESSRMSTLSKDKFISKYGAFIYNTLSYTPEVPRSRVIFLLDQPIMQSNNYVLAVQSLLWLFGTADRACKDSCRFFYGSKGCEFVYINNVLPLDMVKKLIGKYQESGEKEKHRTSRKDYLPAPEQQEVSEALRAIPAWGIGYDEWVQVLMGIHSAFGENGFNLALNWADGKPGEVEQKWKSFKTSGNNSGAVTIATVFGLAKQYGWHRMN